MWRIRPELGVGTRWDKDVDLFWKGKSNLSVGARQVFPVVKTQFVFGLGAEKVQIYVNLVFSL